LSKVVAVNVERLVLGERHERPVGYCFGVPGSSTDHQCPQAGQ
jgi:hypothetical protein